MATFTSYDEVGVKEDVEDVIFNYSPTSTPFCTGIGTKSIHNRVFDWQIDVLDTANPNNALVEGADVTPQTLTATVMLTNTTQIYSKTIAVSGTADAVKAYGRDKESAYQVLKAGKALRRDLEASALSGNAMALGADGTARVMASVQAQTLAQAPGNVFYTGAAGSNVGITEAALLTALETIYTNSDEEPTKCLITPSNALLVATFAQEANRYRTIVDDSKSVTNAVTLYASPYGDIAMVMDRFLLSTDSIIYDPDNWRLAVLRPWTREVLAKTGDATKQMILGEYSLQGDVPIGTGIIRSR